MAVHHISEAEASRDLPALLAKVRAGEDVRIDSGIDTFALCNITSTGNDQPRLISEILAGLKRDASTATLPAGFAKDVQEDIDSRQHEYLMDPWESS